jgi:hypothetical protein
MEMRIVYQLAPAPPLSPSDYPEVTLRVEGPVFDCRLVLTAVERRFSTAFRS